MTKVEMILQDALMTTGVVVPRQTSSKGGRVDVLCRPVPGSDRPLMAMVDQLLAGAEKAGVPVHVCKKFVRKDGKMVFGWNFSVESKTVKELADAVAKVKAVLDAVELAIIPKEDAPEQLAQEPEAAPAQPGPKSEYKTDQQVARSLGITIDSQAGRLGRLAPTKSTTQYKVGEKVSGPRISLVQTGQDTDGRPIMVAEMPLPHVTRELNVPNEKGKGASYIGHFRAGKASGR